MPAASLERFVIGLLLVALFVIVVALVQGIGQSVGHGIVEMLVR